MSTLQELIDRAEAGLERQDTQGEVQAIAALIEAVRLLSQGQEQVMYDISHARKAQAKAQVMDNIKRIHSFGSDSKIGGGE